MCIKGQDYLGLAYVVTRNWEKVIADRHCILGHQSLSGELLAAVKGLENVPDKSRGILYSDLSDLRLMLEHKTSYWERFEKELDHLQYHLTRTGLTVIAENGHKLKTFDQYRWCHRQARAAIKRRAR